MVRAGGAELEDVADSVAEAEGVAAMAGPGFESELTALHTRSVAHAAPHGEPNR
jgi:hypothetical protein